MSASTGLGDALPSPWTSEMVSLFWICMLCATLVKLLPLLLERAARRARRLALRAVGACGPVPTHLAVIMDGNRRWARSHGLQPYEGHPRGFERLIEMLRWCLELDVRMVTVYAFSIENFKRPKKEVDELMSLALDKFGQMLEKKHLIQKHRIRVRVLGNLQLLSPELRKMIAKVIQSTRDFTDGPTLNICLAYTARHEMANAISKLVSVCDDGLLSPTEIDESLLSHCLYTGYGCGGDLDFLDPEILIRTSGERRLSDFMLWQSSHSMLAFRDVMWPDFSAWDLISILLDYRAHAGRLMESRNAHTQSCGNVKGEREKALQHLRTEYWKKIDDIINESD